MKTSEASEGARTLRTSELLRKAADEIRRRGWWQKDYGSNTEDIRNCAVCAWGALNAAMTGDPWGSDGIRPYIYLSDAIKPAGFEGIPEWNDAEGRTVEEVLDALEKAAQTAEAAGD